MSYIPDPVRTLPDIDSELEKIKEAIDEQLSRAQSESNQMMTDLDMNGNDILNLPAPKTLSSPIRVKDLDTATINISAVEATLDTIEQVIAEGDDVSVGGIISVEGYRKAGDWGASYWEKTSDTGTASQTPVQRNDASFTNANGEVYVPAGEINPVCLGADPEGVLDSTLAFNIYNKYIVDQEVDEIVDFLPARLFYPPGQYSVSSVDMTNKIGPRNIHIEAFGCVLVGNTSFKVIFDMTGSRWVWVRGLTTFSPAANPATTGCQLGPAVYPRTCGNNKFMFCNFLGEYLVSSYMNMGSETTQSYSCRYTNTSVADDTYACLTDGSGDITYTSDYVDVTRAEGRAVSLSQVGYYGCQFRHEGQGNSFFFCRTVGLLCDESCYFLAFNRANIVCRATVDDRSFFTTIAGSYENESNQPPYGPATNGVEWSFRIVGDGTPSILSGLELTLRNPRTFRHPIRNETGALITIESFDLKFISVGTDTSDVLFDPTGDDLVINGTIMADGAGTVNLADINSFTGAVYLDNTTTFTPPTTGGYITYSSATDNVNVHRVGRLSYDVWNLINVTSGVAEVKGKLNTINLSGGASETVTAISPEDPFTDVGLEEVTIRAAGDGTLNFTHSSNLRMLQKSDLTAGTNQPVTFVKVASGVWVQTGGYQGTIA